MLLGYVCIASIQEYFKQANLIKRYEWSNGDNFSPFMKVGFADIGLEETHYIHIYLTFNTKNVLMTSLFCLSVSGPVYFSLYRIVSHKIKTIVT